MRRPYAYHVIVMFIQLTRCQGVIRGPLFVIAVAHSLQQYVALKIASHFAKTVIGMRMMHHQGLLGIKGRP
uniref:Uncharacterized protein n=1 Tax=Arundo donax TaxID=35708 RepID=A0A0A9CZ98_ARUDO